MSRVYTKCPDCGAVEKAGSEFAIYEEYDSVTIRFLDEDEIIETETNATSNSKCICPLCNAEFPGSELEEFIIEKEDKK